MADITGSITTGISLEGTLSVTSGSSGEIITGSTISGQIVGGPTGPAGADGADGQGVPVGGTTGQVLAKASATDYDTEWVDAASGGGAVDSVNSQTGVVVLDADDIDDTSTAHKFVTASDLTTLSNTSGTNTGDQDLSTYQLKPSEGAFANGDKTKLDGIETAADVTDTANVTAAGALMDSEVTNLAQVKAFSSADYATAAQGALADSALQSGDIANFETTTELNARDTANRSRSNHTGTQTHATISDYDTELAGTSNVTAYTPTGNYHPATKKYVDDSITAAGGYNDEAAQDAVGGILTDSSEINFTYNDATPSITASIVAGSIDETKLDTSVNASLDLADSATQPGDLATVATTGAYSDLTGTPTIPTVSDTAYDATSWNGNLDAPTKNAVRDKIESMGSGSGDVTGPASSTDEALPIFDGTGGKTLKESPLRITTSGLIYSISPDSTQNWLNLSVPGNSVYTSKELRSNGVASDTISERTAAAGVTIDSVLIKDGEVDGVDVSTTYRTGGTDVALADGGTGASLTDPNADRIMFWDDSAGAVTWLTASTGLTVSGTSMTVRTSSSSQTGIVELATTAETTTATDTARAVTPAGIGAERSATATLTNKTIDGASNTISNIGPSQRTGGFYIGTIAGSTLGSTGNKAITGVGFAPKLVRFYVMPSASAGSTVMGHGAMTSSAQHTESVSSTSTSVSRYSSTSACVSWLSAGSSTPTLLASYVSMDSDGFTINVDTASSAFDLSYEAYG